MTDNHPITPPPELVEQWSNAAHELDGPFSYTRSIATQAARWGADQELEACCEILRGEFNYHHLAEPLRAARRPNPPSLKEQALGLLNEGSVSDLLDDEVAVIRRALEALPD